VSRLLDLPAVSLPASALRLRTEVRAFLSASRRQGDFEPRCDAWLREFSPDFSRALGERGWLGMTWPARYGGHDRTALDRFVVVEELLAAGAPVAAHWVADRQSGPSILRFGNEEQRRELLPRMARGEIFFAIGMSEPDTGSDLKSVRTKAVRQGEDWVVHGTKVWTSHAHRCHYMILLCRTSPAGADPREGLTQFLVDLSLPGITMRPIISAAGEHHFNEVVFDDARIPGRMLLGEEGNGWAQVTAELTHERSGPERFLSTFPVLLALLEEAPADGSWDSEIGRLVADLLALRHMSLGIAGLLEAGHAPGVQAALVKDLGTAFESDVIDIARSLQPRRPSLDTDNVFDRHLAEALLHSPGATLRGGTTEILRGLIAKGLTTP
jgi:alkylation response protein AidB-like acyl-CoA dehydrogenase